MIKKILNGDYLKRMDNIKQWEEKDVFNKESISQHSYKVSVFCRILLEDIFGFNVVNVHAMAFKLQCMDKAMFHDWDEILLTRDISHEVKYNEYNGEKIRKEIDSFVAHESHKEFGLFADGEAESIGQYNPSAHMLISNMTSSSTETVRKFVKLCDWLALLFFVKRERELGNKTLEEQWERCKSGAIKMAEDVKMELSDKFENLNERPLNCLINNIKEW